MNSDEQWAKSYVYTGRALRVMLCPQGSLAVFDAGGSFVRLIDRDELPGPFMDARWSVLLGLLANARDSEIKREAPRIEAMVRQGGEAPIQS